QPFAEGDDVGVARRGLVVALLGDRLQRLRGAGREGQKQRGEQGGGAYGTGEHGGFPCEKETIARLQPTGRVWGHMIVTAGAAAVNSRPRRLRRMCSRKMAVLLEPFQRGVSGFA